MMLRILVCICLGVSLCLGSIDRAKATLPWVDPAIIEASNFYDKIEYPMPMPFARLLADLYAKLPRTKEEFVACGLEIWWEEDEVDNMTKGRIRNLVFPDSVTIDVGHVYLWRLPPSERRSFWRKSRSSLALSFGIPFSQSPRLNVFEQIFGPYTSRTPLDGKAWTAIWKKETMVISVEVYDETQTVDRIQFDYPEEYIPR